MSNQFLKLRRSAVPGRIPTTSSLDYGEIALNTYDGLAFMKKSGSSGEEIITIGPIIGTGSFATTGSNTFYGNQIISGSGINTILQVHGANAEPWAFGIYNDTYNPTQSVLAGFVDNTGEANIGTEINKPLYIYTNANYNNPTVIISSSGVTVGTGGITGSLFGTASWALNALTSSFAASGNGPFSGSFSGSLFNLKGTVSHIPFFSQSQVLDDSTMFQVDNGGGAYSIAINQNGVSGLAPEALFVYQPSPTSYNVISGKGNLNNYLQLNIQNENNGDNASSDIVATANNGNESTNYIDMGINGASYTGFLGGPNDAYIYSTGSNFHIGNINPNTHLGFFVGGDDVMGYSKLQLNPNNLHEMTGSLDVSGSLIVLDGITGSLFGTSSWARNAITSSYALNTTSASYAATASSADNFLVRGTLTAQTIVAQVITASTEFVTGSTKFGSIISNTHQFTGSVSVSGSLAVNGSNVILNNQTSSMSVLSASYASGSTSASFSTQAANASTASYVQNAQTASYVLNAVSASYASSSTSASFASTASFVNPLIQAVRITGSLNISGSVTSTNFTGSLFGTSSWANNALTASYVQNAQTASYILNAVSASYASASTSASFATQAANATTASYVLQAVSASFATLAQTANTASYVQNAQTASYVLNAVSASFATNALTASYLSGYVSPFPYTGSAQITGSLEVTGSTTLSGSLTLRTFSSGSVLFAGTNGLVSQDNTNFFWDDANNRLGIGTNSPTQDLHILKSTLSSALIESTTTSSYASLSVKVGTIGGLFRAYGSAFSVASLANRAGFGPDGATGLVIFTNSTLTSGGTGSLSIRGGGYDTAAEILLIDKDGSTFSKTATLSNNQNAATLWRVSNTTSGASSQTQFNLVSDASSGNASFGKYSTTTTAFKIIGVKNAFIYNDATGGDIAILNDFISGSIKFAGGGSSISQATLTPTGKLLLGTTTESIYLLDVSGSTRITNGLTVTGSLIAPTITGSLQGTASWAQNAVTASYILNAVSASFASTASSADNFLVRGTLTAQTIIAQVITSSTDFVTGSTRFGTLLTNTHQFTGSVDITGSLAVNGSNVILTNQTSSMSVLSSSYATSASYADQAANAVTASYVLNAISSSFATLTENANTASYVLQAVSASYAEQAANANTASYVLQAVSASFATLAQTANTASYILNAVSSSYASASTSASFASTSSFITTLNQNVVITGSLTVFTGSSIEFQVTNTGIKIGNNITDTHTVTGSLGISGSVTATNFTGSLFGTSSWATNALTSSYILQAVSASYASGSTSASYASASTSASFATQAANATTASYILQAVSASYASSSTSASFASTASSADNFLVRGTLTAQTIVAQVITSSTDFVTGSTRFGSIISNTHQFTGSVSVSGSITVVNGVINNLTASNASNSITSSYALTATSASYASASTSASFASQASNAFTASFVQNAQTASYVLQAVSASFATLAQTANTASYVLQAVSASYASASTSASFATTSSYAQNANLLDGLDSTIFATTGSNIFRGNQTVTGSLFTSGSNTLIGTTTLTGSLLITGSTTQIGSNTLIGNTLLSGSITISGSSGPGATTASVQIYGDIKQTGYHRFDPVTTNIDPNISASYIYVSGSTNDLYFSQNGAGYANTTRLRWLEGNLYTGLLNGGLITTQSSTVYQISSGSGIIVNLNASLNNNPYPTVQYLNWGNLTASISAFTASYQQVFVGIDSTANIFAQGTPFSNGQFDSVINIGGVFFQNGSTINAVKTQPSVAYGFEQQQNIFNRAFGPLKLSGYTLAPSGSSTLSLVVASGTAYAPGSNYAIDPNEPSYTVDNGTTISKIFRYRQSGSTWVYDTNAGAGYTTIDPGNYSNNGVLTTVQPNEWSIQRVFWFPNSVVKAIVVYYGNESYSTEADAIANVAFESFVEAPNTAANAIYLGAIIIRGNGDFTTPADFKIQPGGLFRSVGGSGGGGSIVTQTLAGLSDVAISGPTSGQALVYDTTAAKWENKSFISASISGNAATATSAQTASYVLQAVSASYASASTSASFATQAANATTASYVVTAQTASYVLQAVSASFATLAQTANTASYVLNAVSASYASSSTSASFASTASYILNAISSSFASTASSADNFLVRGTLTAQTIVVQTITSSIDFVTGSTRFGSLSSDTHVFTGSISVSGSITGTNGVINNLTASNASNAISASYALVATSASYASGSTSASFAQTASYVLNAVSASYALSSTSASYAVSTSYADNFTVRNFLYVDSASLDYQQNLSVTTGSFQTIVSVATGSYKCAFFDYVAYSGSTVRAGTLVSTWSGSVTEYYENYTADLGGSTSVVTLQTAISAGNIILQAGISGSAWSVRSLVRLL